MSVRVGGLEQIRLLRGHAAERVTGAGAGDGAFVAMHTAVVADLQEERAVAETIAALDALRTTDACTETQKMKDWKNSFYFPVFDQAKQEKSGVLIVVR